MNLVLDIGNTRVKAALFQNGHVSKTLHFNLSFPEALQELLLGKKVERVIYSSVLKDLPAFITALVNEIPCLEFNAETPIPIKNNYKSASTLGSDRLAAAIGGWKHFPDTNLLIIDTGTCIKYNFVSQAGEYLGGAISPGIDMRLKALHHFTGKLPLVKADYDFNILIGRTTQDSLLSGVLNGAVDEMEGMINRYQAQYNDLIIVLTGGNYHFFEKQLKKRIFALPNIVLEGLNEIIAYNVRN
jgi:type III pantothenate kinase